MKPLRRRLKFWIFGTLITAVLLIGGYFGARQYAWPAVKAWRIERMNSDAREFLAAGDYANAVLIARKSLKASTQNLEAWRVAVAASKARDLPEAVSYQDSLCREFPSKENYLELMRLALRFEVPGFVLGVIKTAGPMAREDAEFHRLAARIYILTGQPLVAKFHLVALTLLDPADRVAQLDLAEIELVADPKRKDLALRTRLLALADVDGGARALVALLRENVANKIAAGTEDLVRRLLQVRDLKVADRLLVIEAQALLGKPEAQTAVAALKAEVAEKPMDAARIMDFLRRTGRSAEVGPWFAGLPETTRKSEDVQLQLAEALVKLRDAPALETLLRGGHWERRDFLRTAMLAFAYRVQGRSADYAESWKQALIGAGSDLRKTVTLLARTEEWQWVNERYDVIWKLFALVPTNESVQQILMVWERKQENTVGLNRIFSRIVEVSPSNVAMQGNFIYSSLLLNQNVARTSVMAKDLLAANPKNPHFVTNLAFVLYRQGNAAGALALIDGLSTAEKSEPVRMLLRALFLVTTGQARAATEVMNGVVLTGMLPEERQLGDKVMAEIARLERTQGNQTRLIASREGQGPGAGAAGWLSLVSAEIRSAATTDMQLADSLYAASDWVGLGQLLRSSNWRTEDYLRSALLARVERQADNLAGSQQQWRLALAVADRDLARLQNLRALTSKWQWTPERIETLALIFARTPSDRLILADLLKHYREAKRTSELLRVLGLYVASNGESTDEAVSHAYLSLLLDSNLAKAHVTANAAFLAKPADPARRMVNVFSLWKQGRSSEAAPLITAVPAGASSEFLSIPLIRALILAQQGNAASARESLAQINAATALPEEVALAEKTSKQLEAQAAPNTVTVPRT